MRTVEGTFKEVYYADTQWRDRQGQLHEIEDMSPFHIFCTVKLLKTTAKRDITIYTIPAIMQEKYDMCRTTHPEYFL